MMTIGSVLYSAVGPFLFLTGLASTDVTVPTAAILQRMESLNFLLLSYWFLDSKLSRWSVCNGFVTLLGIVLAVISPAFWGASPQLSAGALYVLMAGYAFSVSLLISKKYLVDIPVSLLSVYRVSLGTLLYHMLIFAIGEDLGGLYSPELWHYMAPYGLVYVFCGQVMWLTALQRATPLLLSIGTTTLFILNLIWSAGLLNVWPTVPQWIGSAFLAVSIASSAAEIISSSEVVQAHQSGGNYISLVAEDNNVSDISATKLTEDAKEHNDNSSLLCTGSPISCGKSLGSDDGAHVHSGRFDSDVGYKGI
jgi:drug/metabolite transporter (DMT)-like permease